MDNGIDFAISCTPVMETVSNVAKSLDLHECILPKRRGLQTLIDLGRKWVKSEAM